MKANNKISILPPFWDVAIIVFRGHCESPHLNICIHVSPPYLYLFAVRENRRRFAVCSQETHHNEILLLYVLTQEDVTCIGLNTAKPLETMSGVHILECVGNLQCNAQESEEYHKMNVIHSVAKIQEHLISICTWYMSTYQKATHRYHQMQKHYDVLIDTSMARRLSGLRIKCPICTDEYTKGDRWPHHFHVDLSLMFLCTNSPESFSEIPRPGVECREVNPLLFE